MTNADKIRAMSDEELAEIIEMDTGTYCKNKRCGNCMFWTKRPYGHDCILGESVKTTLRWLKQEVD